MSILSLSEFLFFFIILIKIDGCLKKYVFQVFFFFFNFIIFHYKVFSLPFIALVEFWFRLILSFFFFLEIGIWVYIKTQLTWLWIWIYLPIIWTINYDKVNHLFRWFHFNFG